nr:unnamed protein product [Digitaria exilis]
MVRSGKGRPDSGGWMAGLGRFGPGRPLEGYNATRQKPRKKSLSRPRRPVGPDSIHVEAHTVPEEPVTCLRPSDLNLIPQLHTTRGGSEIECSKKFMRDESTRRWVVRQNLSLIRCSQQRPRRTAAAHG